LKRTISFNTSLIDSKKEKWCDFKRLVDEIVEEHTQHMTMQIGIKFGITLEQLTNTIFFLGEQFIKDPIEFVEKYTYVSK